LKVGKSLVCSLVKGEANSRVFIPKRIGGCLGLRIEF
jgi:hypothetical protein